MFLSQHHGRYRRPRPPSPPSPPPNKVKKFSPFVSLHIIPNIIIRYCLFPLLSLILLFPFFLFHLFFRHFFLSRLHLFPNLISCLTNFFSFTFFSFCHSFFFYFLFFIYLFFVLSSRLPVLVPSC